MPRVKGLPKLTPTMKSAYARAVQLIEKPGGWMQGQWLQDKDTGKDYPAGWVENGKRFRVCAVGGMQRAAWEALGKPDMSAGGRFGTAEAQAAAQAVNDLAGEMEDRVNALVEADNLVLVYAEDDYEDALTDIMSVNDNYKPRDARQKVLHYLRKAGNLG